MIYDNPWVWLGQVDVELPDGERFWHHVVRQHRAAMMVLIDEQDRALLMPRGSLWLGLSTACPGRSTFRRKFPRFLGREHYVASAAAQWLLQVAGKVE